MAACDGWSNAETAICHSAVEEHPMVPIFPLDQGWFFIHSKASYPSVRGTPKISHSPSE